jgi:hypothetical protein
MSHHFMQAPKNGRIRKVPANEWGRYRATGYTFSNEKDYNEQQARSGAAEVAKPTPVKKKAKKKKRG